MFPDGWVAVARLNPYRVDWREPSGVWTRGAALPFAETRLDSVEMRFWHERQLMEIGRKIDPYAGAIWADFVPPFQPKPLVSLSNGNLLIARTATVAVPEHRYDVVDRQGRLVSQIALALNERIVGETQRGLLVAWRKSDGREELRLFPFAFSARQ